jgi:hypothetical protein
MLDKIDAKVIIDDVRTRHAAVLQLIYFTDTQATSLMRIYVVIGLAGASGSAAALSNSAIPRAMGGAFAAAAIMAVIGAALCMRAMAPADVGFPGREPSFWRWIVDEGLSDADAIAKYLARAEEKLTQIYAVNVRGAAALNRAKWFALTIPIAPVLVGLVAWKCGL